MGLVLGSHQILSLWWLYSGFPNFVFPPLLSGTWRKELVLNPQGTYHNVHWHCTGHKYLIPVNKGANHWWPSSTRQPWDDSPHHLDWAEFEVTPENGLKALSAAACETQDTQRFAHTASDHTAASVAWHCLITIGRSPYENNQTNTAFWASPFTFLQANLSKEDSLEMVRPSSFDNYSQQLKACEWIMFFHDCWFRAMSSHVFVSHFLTFQAG